MQVPSHRFILSLTDFWVATNSNSLCPNEHFISVCFVAVHRKMSSLGSKWPWGEEGSYLLLCGGWCSTQGTPFMQSTMIPNKIVELLPFITRLKKNKTLLIFSLEKNPSDLYFSNLTNCCKGQITWSTSLITIFEAVEKLKSKFSLPCHLLHYLQYSQIFQWNIYVICWRIMIFNTSSKMSSYFRWGLTT